MKKQIDTKLKFNILVVFAIVIFCIAISPITLQNDTYYTIEIGEHILQNGVDMQDPFSMHSNLPYTYPHWAYDVGIYLIYNLAGFWGIYISTVIFACILGLVIYFTNVSISKNHILSFLVTLGIMYILKDFIAARAQLVTFILFALTIFFIEKFLKTRKKRYGIGLIVISIAIANVHCAVWPFYFVLFLPYIAEYIICSLFDANLYYRIRKAWMKHKIVSLSKKPNNEERILQYTQKIDSLQEGMEKSIQKRERARENPYRIKIEKNTMVKWLILIMVICAFTGLLTPIGDTPYTYLTKTMQGNTTKNISEHLPLVLIDNQNMIIVLGLFLAILIFTDTKIKLRDGFMLAGLVLLSFMSRRQTSMLVLAGGYILTKLCASILEKYDEGGTEAFMKIITTWVGRIITISIVILISLTMFKPKVGNKFVDESKYPVQAAQYIKENINLDEMKLFNEYNYGSYLLYEGIPVFIDSRADLYAPEFNGTKGEDGKYQGRDIFSDYINITGIGTWYEDKFEQYGITHVMTQKNTKLNMLISRDNNYKEIYLDGNFIIYERLNVK